MQLSEHAPGVATLKGRPTAALKFLYIKSGRLRRRLFCSDGLYGWQWRGDTRPAGDEPPRYEITLKFLYIELCLRRLFYAHRDTGTVSLHWNSCTLNYVAYGEGICSAGVPPALKKQQARRLRYRQIKPSVAFLFTHRDTGTVSLL